MTSKATTAAPKPTPKPSDVTDVTDKATKADTTTGTKDKPTT